MEFLEALLWDVVLVHVCDPMDSCWRDRVFQHQRAAAALYEESPNEQIHHIAGKQLSHGGSGSRHYFNLVLGHPNGLHGRQAVPW